MSKRPRAHSQQRGDRFEQIAYDLLERLLKEFGFTVLLKRRQRAGTQFGRDLHFQWKDDAGVEHSWFFECKNYTAPPDTTEVLAKLAQAKQSKHRLDCWVLLSPHHDVTNEVDELLEDERKKCPFNIAVWSPASDIADLFSLYPDLYKRVYEKTVSLRKNRRQEILDEWKQKFSKLSAHRQAIHNYCQRLIAANEHLDFRGILQVRQILPLRLEDLYVPLYATTEAAQRLLSQELAERNIRQHLGRLPSPRGRRAGGTVLEAEGETDDALLRELAQRERAPERRVEVAQALRENRRLVILGDPGSGKSILLKFRALTYARGRACIREKFGIDEDRLPILVPIAAYGEAVAQNANLSFEDFVKAANFNPRPPCEVVEDVLERGECLLLLDGLDEVLDIGARMHVSRQIEQFTRTCAQGNRVVVTSRIAGYQRVGFAGDCAHLTLQPFGEEEIRAFVRNWSDAYEQSINSTDWEPRADQRASALSDAILSRPDIQRLASNPLLVTILSLIHQQGTRLPNQRVELYRLCVEALAETWQRARSLYHPIDLYLGPRLLDERYVVGILAPIAFWLFEHRPTGLLYRTELERQIAEWMVTQEGVKKTDAPSLAHQFVELIREQSGLLIERGQDLFDFLHPTFKEYLAARHLFERRNPVQILGGRLFAPRWREVVLLTAGLFRGDHLDDFLNDILKSGTKYDDLLHRPLLLTTRCLADDIPASVALHRQVANRLFLQMPTILVMEKTIHDLFTEVRGSRFAGELAGCILSLAQDARVPDGMRSYFVDMLDRLGGRSDQVVLWL